ncbi:hypothetical protein E7Y30_01685 [Salmonella enterica subsp. enterica serovar Newport]|nr:hypothetical protein [Salmonella enterica]EBK6376442.1 hypothetical protein [Salmonella enterica subsp. enterica serovar Stanley]EBM9870341.1 hypothetical protein [Salmonella enterica subsp. enterica serovar Senftenberg]ECD6461338.1 hypothetical protein [Salmonella enterica subsp. enterica serovar Newport]ECF0580257.1 hypothetical protein [Salmonella enterica subsp. enterica serovar Kentucky]ECF2887154.1 hypothetical protein [Salmonella enterica subsp. enterica serovar Weltevreden]ECJ52815
MGSNEDESIEELERKVKYYNRKLYRIVIIGCLSQLIGFCLYSYLNNYALVFIAIPLFIIAMISLVLFFFLSNEFMPAKIKYNNIVNKHDPISENDQKIMKIQDWRFVSFFGALALYNISAICNIILLIG